MKLFHDRAIESSSGACCIAAIILFLAPNLVHPKDYLVDSREYKLILDEAKLQPDALSAVNGLWDHELKSVIDDSIGLKDKGAHRYSGKFGLSEERITRYWDTVHQGRCVLESHGYSFRERAKIVTGEVQGNNREVALKFRSPDVYLVAKTDMKARRQDAKRKLEEDIVAVGARRREEKDVEQDPDMTPSIRSIYSSSTTQATSAKDKLADVADLFHLYPALEKNLEEEGETVDKNKALALVSDLSLYERVYEGPKVDLGNVTADLSVTLWYNQADRTLGTPLMAELSFKYPLGRQTESVKRIVLRRAMSLFFRMQALEWISSASVTKTAFVYSHANFCR